MGSTPYNPSVSSDELYDLYLDACLAGGEVESAEAFCARHGVRDPQVVHHLRQLEEEHARRAKIQPTPATPFDRLGEYRLIRPLGEGGMGVVYEAVQESLGRKVALKIIRPEFAASAQAGERFRREALAVAKLKHPHIVDVYGMGEENGVRYLAMELLAGESLDERLAAARSDGKSIPQRTLLEWFVALARALQHAHDAGIVHRDVKPSNVHVTSDDRPLLLDFGIARDTALQSGTLTGTFAGSPHYAAPEQIMGRDDMDGRADVYGLGVSLYRALTGRVPFEGGALDQVVRRVLGDEPLSPRRLNPAISRDLETVVLKALARERSRRYRTASAFADDLQAVLDDRPVAARRPSPWTRALRWGRRHPAAATAFAGVVLAVIGAVVLLDVRRRRDRDESLRAARTKIESYRSRRESLFDREKELGRLRAAMQRPKFTRAMEKRLDQLERDLDDYHRSRESMFHSILDHLRDAEALGAEGSEADGLRAALYMERVEEAKAARDNDARVYYESVVVRYDRGGRFARELDAASPLRVEITPADAELYLFRLVKESTLRKDGAPRMVFVPYAGARPRPSTALVHEATYALRVVADHGEWCEDDLVFELNGRPLEDLWLAGRTHGSVRRGDRFLGAGDDDLPSPFRPDREGEEFDFSFERDGREFTIRGPSLRTLGVVVASPLEFARDGAKRVRVWRRGRVFEGSLPAGVPLRPTARPFLDWDAAQITGASPAIGQGDFLLVCKAKGYQTQRYFVRGPGSRIRVSMIAREQALDGFCYVPEHRDRESIWIQEREVNLKEYLEFLRDPAVRATIDAAEDAMYFPRFSRNTELGGYMSYRKGGPIVIPEGWDAHWPVMGVSWFDARAYAAWRTERARAAGLDWEFALPTHEEWAVATGGVIGWDHVWGESFRPRWCNSCRSHRHAFIEPSFRYPVDESLFGLFDCTGNMSEWIEDLYDESRSLRRMGGGNWGATDPISFRLSSGGSSPHGATGTYGFRLVARRAK